MIISGMMPNFVSMSGKFVYTLILSFFLVSCNETGVFEKVVVVPKQQWAASYQPEFSFDIADTASRYRIYFLVRHSDAYEYNNLWIRLHSQLPGDSNWRSERFDIPLASQNKWLGSGMDDIFDHRVLLYRDPVKFIKPGRYQIRIEQHMRISPLSHVFNAGLRVEKLK
jgi:gliding motility-associated lipoprotein GldH